MNKESAIDLLLKAVNMAQAKGVFTLGDARLLADAVDILSPKVVDIAPLPAQTDESVQEATPAEPAS